MTDAKDADGLLFFVPCAALCLMPATEKEVGGRDGASPRTEAWLAAGPISGRVVARTAYRHGIGVLEMALLYW